METTDLVLLFDYYGDLLTDRQKLCFDLRCNQDLSLGEIGQELGISRQGVFDILSRTEAMLKKMEEKTGCVQRDLRCRRAVQMILDAVRDLSESADEKVCVLAQRIEAVAKELEE